ncbi:MAG: hypothetical protein ACE5M4_05540 [Anaerolineales bacterium]
MADVRVGDGPKFSPLNLILDRGRVGSRLRLVTLLAVLGLYWFVVALIGNFPTLIPQQSLANLPVVIAVLLDVFTSFLSPQVLIFVLPVLLAILLSFHLGARYLADLFELESTSIAYRYLLGSVLGLRYPLLTIDAGDVTHLDRQNPLLRIGGPGYLKLHLGFAAVFETIEGQPRIYGPSAGHSRYFIQGFERLRDVIDLRDQLREIDEIRTVTKDGIIVYARDVQIVFRAFSSYRRNDDGTYQADPRSVLNLAYGGIADEAGLPRWTETLPTIAVRELESYVAAHTLEEFLALPSDNGQNAMKVHIPRRELTTSFHNQERKQRLRDLGLELVWVGVGTWEVRDDQIPSTDLEIAAGQTLTGVARDDARARRLRSSEHLGRQRQLREIALQREVILELIAAWNDGQLSDRYRCNELLDRLRRRLIDLQGRVEAAQRLDSGSFELPDRLRETLSQLELLTKRSPSP